MQDILDNLDLDKKIAEAAKARFSSATLSQEQQQDNDEFAEDMHQEIPDECPFAKPVRACRLSAAIAQAVDAAH